MAATTEGRIARALQARVQTLSLSPALPIAWPNVPFTLPAAGGFLRVQHFPNVTARMEISSDGPHRYMGLLQVSVHWPHERGEIEPREVAGQVVAHFPCDLRLVEDGVEVRISKRPAAADMLIEDNSVQIPVSVEYEAYA